MMKSLDISSKGLMAQMLKQDLIANNMANVNTTGFKKELARFSQEVGGRDVAISSGTDFSAGNTKQTDNPLDVAIEGPGFFVVQTDDGEKYTRAGHFVIDNEGTIRTPAGYAILGSSGPIEVDVTLGRAEVSNDGTVTVGGVPQTNVRIVRFTDVTNLKREGDSLYSAPASAGLEDLDKSATRILPGHIEESNVNALHEMVAMISALRSFQAIEKSIRASDDILNTMINRVGRAPGGP